MDYRERQYWDARRDEENARREAERERFRPLNDDEMEVVREVYRLREAEKREREAQGCYCEHGPHNEDLPDWQTLYILREPRRDCPLHSHQVSEFEERQKQAEQRQKQAEQAAQERARRDEEARARANARHATKQTVKGFFLWIAAGIVGIVPATILTVVLMVVFQIVFLSPYNEPPDVFFLIGLIVGAVLWVLCAWIAKSFLEIFFE